jgi:nicotinamidase-related amidase
VSACSRARTDGFAVSGGNNNNPQCANSAWWSVRLFVHGLEHASVPIPIPIPIQTKNDIMTQPLSIDRTHTALLVMDFQKFIVDDYVADSEPLLSRTTKLLEATRDASIMVIYVVVGFWPGYPEVSERNMTFSAIRSSGRLASDDSTIEIHPAVAPGPADIVVTKHRVSAFAGTDLDMILRANCIDTLLPTGILTSGVMLSTLCDAAHADYRLSVVRDCYSDNDTEVHRVLLDKVFPRQAFVTEASTIIATLA